MFKKLISVLIVSFLLFGLCACDLNEAITDAKDVLIESTRTPDITTSDITIENGDGSRTFTMQNYKVSFTVPNDWYVEMDDTDLDIFCTNDDIHMGVYGYLAEDFSEDADFSEIFETQYETDLERFKSIQKLAHTPKFESTDKDIETIIYSVEYETAKMYFYYIGVMPKGDADTSLLWISFGGSPSDVRDNFDMIEDIVDSIKFS